MTRSNRQEPRTIAQLLLLGSYTALALALVVETILMGWELFAIPLVLAAVIVCWFVHIRQRMLPKQRLWIYTVMMMASFFFYGIHVTSTYDIALLMLVVMIIYTLSGESALVTCCQVTYYVTLVYDLIVMYKSGVQWDTLLISRTALHIALMFLAGWLARFIIRQWERMFRDNDEQIDSLDKAAKRMNLFMANLSHELRTPVNAILGTTEVLIDQEADRQACDNLLAIRDAGKRMATQVSDIMDYSELETNRLVVNEEAYTLASLFNDLVAELRPQIPSQLELIIDVDADTPAEMASDAQKLRKILFHVLSNSVKYTREGGVYVHVSSVKQSYGVNLCFKVVDTGIGMSESELEQIFQRFYQADSGKNVRTGGLGLGLSIVNGFVRALGGFLMISSQPGQGTTVDISIPQKVVDDRGCMSVADREKIHLGGYLNIGKFEHPHVREYYNTMILNIVHGLGTPMHRVDNVEDLKKLLDKIQLTHLFVGAEEYLSARGFLESLVDRLAVIVVANDEFTLPEGSRAHQIPKPLYGFPIANILNAGIQTQDDRPSRMPFSGVRALVVDDEPMNLSAATGILRRYGIRTTTAASGEEAVRLCTTSDFDLVFMDHMMPGMDGVETMKRIRSFMDRIHKELPIVALTANALSGAREMFMKEGFDGFVSKPIEIPELERVLWRILSKRRIATVEEVPPSSAPVADDTGKAATRHAAETVQGLSGASLHVESGLRYCQNDEAFYLSLLEAFAEEHSHKRDRLEELSQGGDLTDYAILVHALKSTAKMIGADTLSEQAKVLEDHAKKGDGEAVARLHGRMLEEYDAVAALIRAHCPRPDQQPPSDAEEIMGFDPEGEDI